MRHIQGFHMHWARNKNSSMDTAQTCKVAGAQDTWVVQKMTAHLPWGWGLGYSIRTKNVFLEPFVL
jgi:hypothetical protein